MNVLVDLLETRDPTHHRSCMNPETRNPSFLYQPRNLKLIVLVSTPKPGAAPRPRRRAHHRSGINPDNHLFCINHYRSCINPKTRNPKPETRNPKSPFWYHPVSILHQPCIKRMSTRINLGSTLYQPVSTLNQPCINPFQPCINPYQPCINLVSTRINLVSTLH